MGDATPLSVPLRLALLDAADVLGGPLDAHVRFRAHFIGVLSGQLRDDLERQRFPQNQTTTRSALKNKPGSVMLAGARSA